MKAISYLGLALVALTGCVGNNDASDTSDVSATQYVTILEFPNGENEGAWYDINSKLSTEFENLCGDTFCGGDYANLTPLTLTCSVSSKAGAVHECAWTFAGSQVSVDPKTSVLTIDAPIFECRTHPKTTAAKLIKLLSTSDDAIHAPLSATDGSLYDELGDCFQHPINATPITYPQATTPTYVDANEYYQTASGQAKWEAAKAALKAGFDNVCGDTFCGSDYGDLQSLDFRCSVTKSTGNVKDCAWIFGGSFGEVAAKGGAVNETAQTWTCKVPVKGTIGQLVTTLTAAGTEDATRRPLPGQTTTAYDAIANNCLP